MTEGAIQTDAPLFDSPSLRVVRTTGDPARGREPVDLVTFEPWRARQQRLPFGRAFAEKYRLNALHVLPAGDDWYQYDDLPAALAAVAPHVGPRTLGYGSSMGGYAVTTYGDLAGFRRIFALSPQFTIHLEAVPFERRWAADAARIRFRDDHAAVARGARIHLLCDPANPDAEHARLIAQGGAEVMRMPVPGGGHPVGPVLAEAGLLSLLVLDLVRTGAPPADFAERMREALPRSPRWIYLRALRTRHDRREALLRRGLALAPGDLRLRHARILDLWARGERAEALAEMRRLLARRPAHPVYARQLRMMEEALARPFGDGLAAPPRRGPRPA